MEQKLELHGPPSLWSDEDLARLIETTLRDAIGPDGGAIHGARLAPLLNAKTGGWPLTPTRWGRIIRRLMANGTLASVDKRRHARGVQYEIPREDPYA